MERQSILRASDDFFSATSPSSRVNGIELHERLARRLIEKMVVSRPGELMLLTEAYERFGALVKERELVPVKRIVFKELVTPLIRDRFGSGLRSDLVVEGRYSGVGRIWL